MYGVTFCLCSKIGFSQSKSSRIVVKIEATSVLKEECSSHFCEVNPTGGINVGIKKSQCSETLGGEHTERQG